MLNSSIDMVIRVEDWNREANYDRLGLEEDYIEFLGNKVVCYSIPIRPGRNPGCHRGVRRDKLSRQKNGL